MIVLGFYGYVFFEILLAPRWLGTKRPRATVSYLKGSFRYYAMNAHDFYKEQGCFPPKMDGTPSYGPVDMVFGKDNSRIVPSDFATGPILDPHREQALFPGEQRSVAMYNSPRNPDGWVKLKGYPPRYFRSKNGQWALFISNGPDDRITITKEFLFSMDFDKKTDNELFAELSPLTYDPSNGVKSTGDVWRLLTPDQ